MTARNDDVISKHNNRITNVIYKLAAVAIEPFRAPINFAGIVVRQAKIAE
jgi:hypothetical protein